MITVLFEASTVHIERKTDTWLTESKEEASGIFLYDELPYGYLFYIVDYDEIAKPLYSEDPFKRHSDLHELIQGVLKVAPSCTHLLLDADGPKHPKLFKSYNWDDESDSFTFLGIDQLKDFEISMLATAIEYDKSAGRINNTTWRLSYNNQYISSTDIANLVRKGIITGESWTLNFKRTGEGNDW